MKKILLACLFLYLGYVGFQDWKAGNAVQYVSPEGSKERVADRTKNRTRKIDNYCVNYLYY